MYISFITLNVNLIFDPTRLTLSIPPFTHSFIEKVIWYADCYISEKPKLEFEIISRHGSFHAPSPLPLTSYPFANFSSRMEQNHVISISFSLFLKPQISIHYVKKFSFTPFSLISLSFGTLFGARERKIVVARNAYEKFVNNAIQQCRGVWRYNYFNTYERKIASLKHWRGYQFIFFRHFNNAASLYRIKEWLALCTRYLIRSTTYMVHPLKKMYKMYESNLQKKNWCSNEIFLQNQNYRSYWVPLIE